MAFELIQDVAVLDVETDGLVVLVDVYGGPTNACASVRYTFRSQREASTNVASLRRWATLGTVLSLVIDSSTVTIVDERSLLRRALEPAS